MNNRPSLTSSSSAYHSPVPLCLFIYTTESTFNGKKQKTQPKLTEMLMEIFGSYSYKFQRKHSVPLNRAPEPAHCDSLGMCASKSHLQPQEVLFLVLTWLLIR